MAYVGQPTKEPCRFCGTVMCVAVGGPWKCGARRKQGGGA
jgi:hypothetical protein